MAKFQVVFVLAVVALALVAAEPAQRRRTYARSSARLSTRTRSRVLARQEAGEVDVVTPYPSADELKPEIPFEEAEAPLPADAPADAPVDGELPAEQVPDEVYGPPEFYTPDEVYGPPEVSEVPENELPAADPAAEQFPAPVDEQTARLVAARRAAKLRRAQRLRKAAALKQAGKRVVARPAKLRSPAPRAAAAPKRQA